MIDATERMLAYDEVYEPDVDRDEPHVRPTAPPATPAHIGGRGSGVLGVEAVAFELPPPASPIGVARALVQQRFGAPDGSPVLRHWRGGWWRWNTSHWGELEDASIRTTAYRFTENAVYVDGDKTKPWAPNRHKIADVLDALRAVTHLDENTGQPTWIEGASGPDPRKIVACDNGLLEVTTRQLRPHDPRFFNQVAVPFAYNDDAPVPTRWLAFVEELWPEDPDAIEALQEFFGYVISGRTDLHKIMLLIGPTRGGKGVIARVLTQLIGKPNVTGPTLASLGQNFGLQDLIGKPLAIISDARLGGTNTHAVVERLLSVSGEDTLTIDRKYRDPWTGQLPTRFLVISNELPSFGDASGAIANRFVVLTLSASWLGRENPALTGELSAELPGILNWALDGLERLAMRDRFTEPRSSTDAILALADLVSPVAAFVRDRCTRGASHEVTCDDLYHAWKVWAEDNGHRSGSAQTFGRNLRAVVPGVRTSQPRDIAGRRRVYLGVSLRSETHNG